MSAWPEQSLAAPVTPAPASTPPYRLRHPAQVPNHAGYEVQCLAGRHGWINAFIDERGDGVVFASREQAHGMLHSMIRRAGLEYRLYPSVAKGRA